MKATIERVSAITLKVADMEDSVRFYRDVLGLELLYGGPQSGFSSLRVPEAEFPIINLQQGSPETGWGRTIFHVADVDAFWAHEGLNPDNPHDGA